MEKRRIMIVCRHAKARSSDTGDKDRVITKEGIEETQKFIEILLKTLKKESIVLTEANTLCMSSTATRAIQTMDLLTKAFGINYEQHEKLYSLNGSQTHFHWLEEKILATFENYEIIIIMAHEETGYFLSWLSEDGEFKSEDQKYNLLAGKENPYRYKGLMESSCFIMDFDNPKSLTVTPYWCL